METINQNEFYNAPSVDFLSCYRAWACVLSVQPG